MTFQTMVAAAEKQRSSSAGLVALVEMVLEVTVVEAGHWLTLSLLRVINVKFLLQPHQKYYITQ